MSKERQTEDRKPGGACAWCLERYDYDHAFDHPVFAWRVYIDDQTPHMACKYCAEDYGIWAVGEDGMHWDCGGPLDEIPPLSEDAGVSVDTMGSNAGFTGRDPGIEGLVGKLA